jgi:hypothetical protein
MIGLKIESNVKDIVASLTRFAESERTAVVRALNKTAIQARTAASQEVRGVGYNIKASAIKRSFAINRASKDRLIVVLRATGAPIALINYSARQTKSGVSINVKGGRKLLKHAFIATMSNGHKGVFERVGIARTGGKVMKNGKMRRANLPVRELFGPSIPTALGNEVVERAIMKKIEEKFPKILASELNFLHLNG